VLSGNASCSGMWLPVKGLSCSRIDEGMGVHIHVHCCIGRFVYMSKNIRVLFPVYIAMEGRLNITAIFLTNLLSQWEAKAFRFNIWETIITIQFSCLRLRSCKWRDLFCWSLSGLHLASCAVTHYKCDYKH